MQKNIRNIATSAHIHHGKCISGDSRLILTNGKVKTAKEIYEEISKDGKLFQENEEHTIFNPDKKVEIFSLNKDNGKLEKKEIQHAWRLVGGKTIKVKLRNGFKIETTPEHKYVVSKEGSFVDVEAGNLRLGDRVVCARKLNINSEQEIKKEILERLSKENFYVNLSEDFSILLSKKILSYGIKRLGKEIGFSVKEKSFYHGLWKNRYCLNDLIKILKFFEFDLNLIYDKIEFIYYRTGKQRGQNSLKIKLPQNFEELFYLAGLFLGDGSGKKFIVGKKELGERLISICNSLGINTKKVECENRTPEVHTNMTLAYVLKSLFDYPLKKKSHNINISNFVLNSCDEYISKLLKGYFDTDGCVEKSRRAVTISSVSNKMIDDLHLLLLRFGCISIKEKDNAISISGASALNFMKNIGFGLKEKEEKLRMLCKKVCGGIVCDSVKVGNKVMLRKSLLKDRCDEDLAYVEINSIEQGFQDVVYDFTIPETHNFVAEGPIIHNTAFTDNLLAAAGQMASKNAGNLDEGMATWQHSDEQERLMTVDSANVSMVHEYEGEEYLVNLIDTPGHVDFGGNVTRAMRAIDGTVVLVCASEGIMPQTETVLKQALKERVKPLLFINKVDRLIKELKMTPEQMQARFMKIFKDFNDLVHKIAEPDFKDKWLVDINDGSVAFGSAKDNWALSLPFMKKKNVSFKDIIDAYNKPEDERKAWFWDKAPLFEVSLDMAVKHLPNPVDAQKYRIPKIWHGDLESDFGKSLLNCDPKGKLGFVATRIVIDPKSGKEVTAGRIFSGTLKPGMDVYLNMAKRDGKIQQVLIYNGIRPEQMEEIPAGNVLAVSGVDAEAGETITEGETTPFEELKHIFEPVITQAIEVTRSSDLPKLIEVLRKVGKEDPSIHIEINEETGENLMSGMGELHLEIVENRIKTEKGVEVKTSPPIVVYRETVAKDGAGEGKSPNKHNIFVLEVEPLEDNVWNAIKEGNISETRYKKKDENLTNALRDLGVENDEIKQYRDVYKGNVFLDRVKGEVHMLEVIEMILDAFEQVCNAGPLAREPCTKLKVSLVDIKLHEDAIHRGPAQVYPAIRDAMQSAMRAGNASLLEPLQIQLIEAPNDFMSSVTKLVSAKRGQLLDVSQDEVGVEVKGKIPVAEMLGWSSDLRSATEGRGVSSLVDQMFERIPSQLQEEVIKQIRSRKGLAENQ